MATLRALCQDDRGATAVEYALLIATIMLAIIAALAALSGGVNNTLNHLSDTFKTS